MTVLLRLASYLFHPLVIPLLGWVSYILIQPHYPNKILFHTSYKDTLLFLLIIPIVLWVYLKLRNKIEGWDVEKVNERSLPLFVYVIILLLYLYLTDLEIILPFKTFIYGILSSVLTCWILTFAKSKISLHQMATSALLVFTISLSVFFKVNLLLYISALIVANGWVASSRLFLGKHRTIELILGAIIGGTPQLYLVSYWL